MRVRTRLVEPIVGEHVERGKGKASADGVLKEGGVEDDDLTGAAFRIYTL